MLLQSARRKPVWIVALLLTLAGTTLRAPAHQPAAPESAETPSAEEMPVNFAKEIAPLFENHCIRCHQASAKQGELSLATRTDLVEGGFIVPGKPEESYLLAIISPQTDGPALMPKEGQPLSESQIALVRRWIGEGARWPEDLVLAERAKADLSWWSLQPLRAIEPPSADEAPQSWRTNAVDRFVHARLASQGLQPNPPADRVALIRRLTYDLTGLPPTPSEVEAFVDDPSPDAYERLVDRLLASPHYGEHWGRHWLDVVRFGESSGFEQNFLIDNIWPFRDYVIRALNEDRPFNQLILEHLAGDTVAPGDPEVEVALTFLVCGPFDSVGNQDAVQAAQIRANAVDEMIRTASEAFLGLTVGCARCHNHKFDPISQRDYYSLYATFAGVYHDDRVVATDQQRAEREQRLQPLVAQRDALAGGRSALVEAIVARASSEFAGRWTREPIDRTGVEEIFEPVEARFVRLAVEGTEANPAATTGFRLDEFEVWTDEPEPRNVAAAAAGGRAHGKSPMPGDFGEAYGAELAIDGQFGERWLAAGPELVIELAQPSLVRRVVFSSDRQGALGQHPAVSFVCEYRIEVSSDGQRWTVVADSHDRQPLNEAHRRKRLVDLGARGDEQIAIRVLQEKLSGVEQAIAAEPPLPVLRVGRFEQPGAAQHVFERGDPQQPGEAVVPSSLSTLAKAAPGYELAADVPEQARRRALAEWIAADENPLTPRVLANRVWHYHFGAGIVDTPSDLGYMGGRPTHPELLDWLAGQLIASGWQIKPLHKLIVMSQAYQQSADYREEAARVDADSRLLWRFPPRRLSGEEIRDAMLLASGKLDLSAGGPGFRLYRYLRDNVSTYIPLDEVGPETYRRAVYHQNARASRIDLVTDFDGPDCAYPTPRRIDTTTPLQALTMMNHRFPLDMAGLLAERVSSDAVGDEPSAQVRRAFQWTLGRDPSADETADAVKLVEQHGLRALCRALLNCNEFIYLN